MTSLQLSFMPPCHFVSCKDAAGLADVDVVFEDLAAAVTAVHDSFWPGGYGGTRGLCLLPLLGKVISAWQGEFWTSWKL